MSARVLETLPLDQLRPWPRNARTHSRKQIRQIAESIRRFGFTNPVLIDGENRILAGHGRVEAARELGMATVPCLRVDHLSPAEKRAYVLADNKLALNAGWDEELLALELKELMEADIEFDVERHRLLDRRGRPAGRRPCAGGGRRSGGRQASGSERRSLALPPRRHLAARPAPAGLWRLARSSRRRRPDGRREGRDGLHRSALQRRDRRQRQRARQNPPSRVCDGVGRDDARSVHRFPVLGLRQSRCAQLGRLDPLRLHGLAAHGRDAGGRGRELLRAQESDRLGQGQWRHGSLLSLPP